MKNLMKTALVVSAILVAAPVAPSFADGGHSDTQTAQKHDQKTVTFSIDKMTCAMCPITVRKAMEKVDGVTSVVTSFEDKTAVVTFDPAKADLTAIAKASEMAGYPATLEDHKDHKGE